MLFRSFLKKLKIEVPYDPATALLGIYPRDTGVLFQRGTRTPMFIAALSTIAKVWKEPKCPSMDELIKMWYMYIYTYIHIYVHTHTHTHTQWGITRQSKRILPFATTWRELECVMLSEISQRKANTRFHSYVEFKIQNR